MLGTPLPRRWISYRTRIRRTAAAGLRQLLSTRGRRVQPSSVPAAGRARRPAPRHEEDDPRARAEVKEEQRREAAAPVGDRDQDRERDVTGDDRRPPDHDGLLTRGRAS